MVEIRRITPSQAPAADAEAVIASLMSQGAFEKQTSEAVTEYVARWSEYEAARILVAEEAGEPVGWLAVMPWDGGYATLHPLRWSVPGWPTIVPHASDEAVGSQLMAAAEALLPKSSRSVLTSIDRDVPLDPDRLDVLRRRYEDLGFHFADLVHFIHPTASDSPAPLDAIDAVPLGNADSSSLAACIRDVFSDTASPFFCEGDPDEQASFIRTLPDSPAIKEASSVGLVLGDDLIGFASTIGNRENGNLLIDWMGIRPAWQRQGYGRFLLQHILASASADGYATASLSSDAQNKPALALYKNEGWEIEGGERQFVKQLG